MQLGTGYVSASVAAVVTLLSASARAQAPASPQVPAADPPPLRPAGNDSPLAVGGEAPLEAPPPPPRKKGVVVESRVGALVFLGDFRHIAPAAPWFHIDAGYEILSWLGIFAYGELSFTDTSEAQGPSNSTAFPIYGFGGGPRVTFHATPRVAFFLEGDVGTLRADVPRGALADLGYGKAETFGVSFGGRLGVEWYQIDRHLAFGAGVGVRDATGFAQQFLSSGPPLMLDANAGVRYTF